MSYKKTAQWLLVVALAFCASCTSTTETSALPETAHTSASVRMSGSSASQAATELSRIDDPPPATGDTFLSSNDGLLPANTPLSLIEAATSGFLTQKVSELEVDARTGDCMRSLGFEYFPLISPHTYFVGDFRTIGEWHQHAKQFGYGIYYGATEAGFRDTQEQFGLIVSEDLPEFDRDAAYWIALIGRPDGSLEQLDANPSMSLSDLEDGCLRQAIVSFRKDHGLPDLSEPLFDDLLRVDYDTSGDFQKALDDWLTCMSQAGIEVGETNTPYSRFEAAYLDGHGLASPLEAQAQFNLEREAAVTHAECEWKHLLGPRLALEHAYLTDLVEAYPEIAPFLAVAGELID